MNLGRIPSGRRLSSLLLGLLLSRGLAAAYTPEPRWGQAAVIVNDVLFVHGGKTDQFNSYSYTSAPNTNDLLYLSLSRPFDAANPPWELVSSSTNLSTSQGPALSWHTLSAFNDSGVLLFGGQPGPNSPTVIVHQADSAFLLDVSNRLQPVWYSQPLSWGGQPVRRIYHSSTTSPSGLVYIIGGLMADGSGHAFSEHYVFDPRTVLFSQLPSDNGPPALYGHTSLMFTDGRLFVLGGVAQGSLIPFSTIWVLDTTKDTPVWALLQVDPGSVPEPRRAFAAAVIAGGKILIQGGSDENLQTNFDDGWILDTSKVPAIWTRIEQLTQIGARRDHCAISSNGQVLFAFGYSDSRPAPTAVQIFDPSSNSYLPSYTPPSPASTITQTIPGQTVTPTGTGLHSGSPTETKPSGSVHPTSTAGPGVNAGDDDGRKKPIAAIIVGTTLGVLGAVVIVAVVIIYSRRQQRMRGRSFMAIGDDDDGGGSSLHAGPIIPTATMYEQKSAPGAARRGFLSAAFSIAGTIGAVTKSRNPRDVHRRRDMLADEDTRDFGEWYHARRRDGTSGSSWSLKTILGARFRSREPSTFSHGSASHHPDKTDPFSDGTSLLHGEEPGPSGFEGSVRPNNRQETSYASTGHSSYVDPFADPSQGNGTQRDYDDDEEYEPTSAASTLSLRSTAFPTIRTVLPVSMGGHPLSPLSEHTSKTSLPSNDHTISSSSYALSSENPFETSATHTTSQTTTEPTSSRLTNPPVGSPRSPKPLSSSIIPASIPLPNVRRSDSWWSRFYHTSFLDRKSSSASQRSTMLEIRDPNPPPVLGPIRESIHSGSADDSSSKSVNHTASSEQLSRTRSKVYATDPGKSMTSLRTADTEQIERMAGTMDVVQRVRTRSQRTDGSISSGLSIDTHQTGGDGDGSGELATFASPVETIPSGSLSDTPIPRLPSPIPPVSPLPRTPPRSSYTHVSSSLPTLVSPAKVPMPETSLPSSLPPATSTTPVSGSSVAARVQIYERRSSQNQERLPPTNTKRWEERSPKKNRVSVDYGFAPRPSLFVANPDHRNSPSSDS